MFWMGLVVGLFIGTTFGAIMFAVLTANSEASDSE